MADIKSVIERRRAAAKRAKAAERRQKAAAELTQAKAEVVHDLVQRARGRVKRAEAAERREARQAAAVEQRKGEVVRELVGAGRARAATKRTQSATVGAAVEHRKTANRLLDRQVLTPMRELYEEEGDALARGLRRAMRGQMRSNAGAREVYDKLSGVIDAKMQQVAARLANEMVVAQKGTLAESADALAAYVGKAQGRATLLDDPVVRDRVMRAQRQAMEASQRESATRLAAGIRDALQRRLNVEVQNESTIGQAINALNDELDAQWWQVERLVRTETARAFNEGQRAGIEALAAEEPGVLMRWTEHVHDLTGEPMDDRVGKDSLVLHGQVAKPGKAFVMPPDARAPKGMVGQSWMHPPNRPNDRAVLLPWFPGSGIPAWMWQRGRRVKAG